MPRSSPPPRPGSTRCSSRPALTCSISQVTTRTHWSGSRCSCCPPSGEPTLIVPRLERPAAEAADPRGVRIVDHADGSDPYALVGAALGGKPEAVGLGNRMWAEQVLALRAALPGAEQRLAGAVLRELRMRKSPGRGRGAAPRPARPSTPCTPGWASGCGPAAPRTRSPPTSPRAIRAAGHATVDFVIVGRRPQRRQPAPRHLRPGHRAPASPVVVDIGGTMPDGYCSDSHPHLLRRRSRPPTSSTTTRCCSTPSGPPSRAVRPGVTAESVDAAARDVDRRGRLRRRVPAPHRPRHRPGRARGAVHRRRQRPPARAPGMAFSIEPGIYLAGRHGARIEDIVVCTDGRRRAAQHHRRRELVDA